MNGETRLTVAICVYNGEKYLAKTLASIKDQSYENYKILALNDGSTDSTLAILQDFANSGGIQTDIISNEMPGGIGAARHKALNHINTEYTLFFDADDIAKPQLFERMVQRLDADENLLVIGSYESLIDSDDHKLPGGTRVGFTDSREALEAAEKGKLFFLPMRSMFRTEYAKQCGGFVIDGYPSEGVRYADYCEDCDLWTRMSDFYSEGKYLLVIPEELIKYRKHNSSVSHDSFSMLLKMRYIKNNVRRRRQGLKDVTFSEFIKGVSEKEMKRLKREAKAGQYVRRAGFDIQKRRLIRACGSLICAVVTDPGYVFEKIQAYSKKVTK